MGGSALSLGRLSLVTCVSTALGGVEGSYRSKILRTQRVQVPEEGALAQIHNSNSLYVSPESSSYWHSDPFGRWVWGSWRTGMAKPFGPFRFVEVLAF